MKKALWISNIIIPEFACCYGVKRNPVGGWISGMLKAAINCGIEVAMVFPIRDESKMIKGQHKGCYFYSIRDEYSDKSVLSDKRQKQLEEIIMDYRPDIVHIWGTEFAWSLETVRVCEQLSFKNVIISIQGLVSVCADYYCLGIPDKYLKLKLRDETSIEEGKSDFINRGKNEIECIQKAEYFFGRTKWDYSCIKAINPKAKYIRCRCILRDPFYDNEGQWSYGKCNKKSIFISQGGYPIKGLHFFLKAFAIVKSRFPDAHVVVSGTKIKDFQENSQYVRYLMEIISENNLSDSIEFVGILDENEMIKEYLKANVFVSASLIENESNSVLEAMMLGVPVVSSYVGGIPTYLRDEKDGLFFPSMHVEMLANAIIELFESKELCERLSKGATHTAHRYCDKKAVTKELLEGYNSIV